MIFPLCTTQISGLLWIGGSCSDGTSQSRHCHQAVSSDSANLLSGSGVGNTLLAGLRLLVSLGFPSDHLSPVPSGSYFMPQERSRCALAACSSMLKSMNCMNFR